MRRLRAALNLALEERRAYANPMAWKVSPFENVEVARAVFLSEKDQRTFVKACGGREKDFQRLVRAGLYTGARYGELGRLAVVDFNASAGTLFIAKSKGGQQRYVHLDPEAMRFSRKCVPIAIWARRFSYVKVANPGSKIAKRNQCDAPARLPKLSVSDFIS